MIIGINGYIGSGKDTVGNIIRYAYPQEKYEIKKFVFKLKQIASILTGIPQEKFEDQDFKKTFLSKEWTVKKTVNLLAGPKGKDSHYDYFEEPLVVREFLQKLGTEAIRNNIHTNAWVNALFADYIGVPDGGYPEYGSTEEGGLLPIGYNTFMKYPNWIITDCRFPNEAEAIKQRGGIIIRINRNLPQVEYQRHPSETSLDEWEFDHVVENNGTMGELIDKIKSLNINQVKLEGV